MELFVVLQQRRLLVQSNAGDQQALPHSGSPACPSVFRLLIGSVSRRRAGGEAEWWDRHDGTGGRHAAATDQTRALAAGTGGSNTETSVAAQLACVGSGKVKRQMGERRVSRDRWTATIPGRRARSSLVRFDSAEVTG